MTLTVDDLREHVESSLGDDALGLLLAAAYESIDQAVGVAGYDDVPASVTEVLTGIAGDLLMLSRPATAIVTLLEDTTTLVEDDYQLLGDQMIRRLDTGTNPRRCWGRRIIPTYEPLPDENNRDRAAIALVELDLNHQPGVTSERLGDHAIGFATDGSVYTAEREAILASLSPGFIAK